MRRLLMLALLLAPITACRESPPAPSPDQVGPNMSGKLQRKMANCPSAVPGAVTRVELTASGADVIVTAASEEAQRHIVRLADFHQRTPAPVGPMAHTGLRGGNSTVGYCPIVHRGATITTTRVPSGIRIHLRADTPRAIKDLQDIVSARAARLPGFASS